MAKATGKFTISFADLHVPTAVFEQEGIFLGRLDSCEILLDHPAVSRVHAAINFQDERYQVVNVSSSNIMTLNGRLLGPQKSDILVDGDTIQIGPYTIQAAMLGEELLLVVERAAAADAPLKPAVPAASAKDAGVLDVFWEKRTRDKEDWGTRLRPTAKPLPGKAMINWKPTGDLRRPWKMAVFVWALLLVGGIAVFAYYKYPTTYAPMPLANPHALAKDESKIANASNGNSCTTCHMANQPVENACIKCHNAVEFHASNTKAHQDAGITCTVCHQEHKGPDNQLIASAIASCSACHNDATTKTFNGKSVRTPHGGSYGYPVENGVWKWKGVYRETAELIPEINSPATGDANEQARLSRHFHSIHVARLKAPAGLTGDKFGLVSCSTCHKSFTPIDRATPKATCAACHTVGPGSSVQDARFASGSVNCISCHVQHAYSATRWSEFLSEESLKRRNDAVAAQIERLGSQ
jgi:hypothetical protein